MTKVASRTPRLPRLTFHRRQLYLAILASSQLLSPAAFAGPQGGNIVGGTGSIEQTDLTTTITQQTDRLAINWDSFNVGADERVSFIQPGASSIALNRIMGNNGSEILGQVDANGHVVLVNPHGIFFGESATVNVGGLIASGLDINPQDFMNGDFSFAGLEGTEGTVINSGLIQAATGGSVTLLGKQVKNDGLIMANLGAVSLAAGNAAVLTFDASGMMGVQITEAMLQDELGVDPALLNDGDIQAAGGRILLTASTSRDIFSRAVNAGDMAGPRSVVVHDDGSFTLGGGADVVNTGRLDVSSMETNAGDIALIGENVTNSGNILADSHTGNAGQIEVHAAHTALLTENSRTSARAETGSQGGQIKVLGHHVGLFDQAEVDASGALGGGQVYIGGDYQGSNPYLPNAYRTYVGADAAIYADALTAGDGGRVIVWADDVTRFYGNLFGRGAGQAGRGGFAEVSGKEHLHFDGYASLSGPAAAGHLLLDPRNITISNTGIEVPDGPNDPRTYAFDDNEATSVTISSESIEGLLTVTSVTLQATENITVGHNILAGDANSDTTLTLEAGNNIAVNASIDLGAGNMRFIAGHIDCDLTTCIRTMGGGNFTLAEEINLNAAGNIYIAAAHNINMEGFIGNASSPSSIHMQAGNNINLGGTINANPNVNPETETPYPTVSIMAGFYDESDSPVAPLSDFDLDSDFGLVVEGNLTLSGAVNTQGGGIQLSALGAVTVGAPVTTQGGDFTVTDSGTFSNAAEIATGANQTAGNITINSTGDVNLGELRVGVSEASGAGGNVLVNAGGDISLDHEFNFDRTGNNGDGGGESISLIFNAGNHIFINERIFDSSGYNEGRSYFDTLDVELNANQNNNNLGSINIYAPIYTGGGNFSASGRFFNSQGQIINTNNGNENTASSSTTGGHIHLEALVASLGSLYTKTGEGNGDLTISAFAEITANAPGSAMRISGNTELAVSHAFGYISLAGPYNEFSGYIFVRQAPDVIIANQGDIRFGRDGENSQINGDLTLTSHGGGIDNAGLITVGGNAGFNLLANADVDGAGRHINFNGYQHNINGLGAITTQGGNFSLTNAGELTLTNTIGTQGGDVTLAAAAVDFATSPTAGVITTLGGSVALTAEAGSISTRTITTQGGNVTLSASDDLTTGSINTSGSDRNGGNIDLTAQGLNGTSGNITTGALTTNGGIVEDAPGANAGDITLSAMGDITANGNFSAIGGSGNGNSEQNRRHGGAGGAVDIHSTAGSLTVRAINTSGGSGSTGVSNGANHWANGGDAGNIDLMLAGDSLIGRSIQLIGNLTASGGASANNHESSVSGRGGDIEISGRTLLNSSITINTSTLGQNADLTGFGSVTFYDSINSASTAIQRNLTINAGAVNINGSIGDTARLGVLNLTTTNDVDITGLDLNVGGLTVQAPTFRAHGLNVNGDIDITANGQTPYIRIGGDIVLTNTNTDPDAPGPTATFTLGGLGEGGVYFDHNSSLSSNVTVNGNGNNNTLRGLNTNNVWTLTGTGSGSIRALNSSLIISFSDIHILEGNSQSDRYYINADNIQNMTIHGNGGENWLYGRLGAAVSNWEMRSANSGLYSYGSGGSGQIDFEGVSVLWGRGQNDIVDLRSENIPEGLSISTAYLSGTDIQLVSINELHANPASNHRLIGQSLPSTWDITGVDEGRIFNLNFYGIPNLVGGSQIDTFNIRSGGSVSGYIDGNSATNYFILTSGVHGQRVRWHDNFPDNFSDPDNSVFNLVNFSQLTAYDSRNTLEIIGSGNNTWRINPSTINSEVIDSDNSNPNSRFNFHGYGNLQGGSGNDTFIVASTAGFAGQIDGGGGFNNTVDLSARTEVQVSLGGDVADGDGIELLRINTLVGNGTNATLTSRYANSDWILSAGIRQLTGLQDESPVTTQFSGFTQLVGTGSNDFLAFDTSLAASLTGGSGENNFNLTNVDLAGTITGGTGDNTYTLQNSRVAGGITGGRASGDDAPVNNTLDLIVTLNSTGVLDFRGANQGAINTINITSNGTGYDAVHSLSPNGNGLLTYSHSAANYQLNVTNPTSIQDDVAANRLTLSGASAVDQFILQSQYYRLNSDGFRVDFSNKRDLTINAENLASVILSGTVVVDGAFEINGGMLRGEAGHSLQANTVTLNATNGVGQSTGDRLSIDTRSLAVNSSQGAILLDGQGDINLVAFSDNQGTFDLRQAGDITASTPLIFNNAIGLASLSGNIALTQPGHQLGGLLTLSAGSGDVALTNNGPTQLGDVRAQNLNLTTAGGITGDSIIQVTGNTSLQLTSGDIQLTGANHFGDLSIDGADNVTLHSASLLNLQSVNAVGQVDTQSSGLNLAGAFDAASWTANAGGQSASLNGAVNTTQAAAITAQGITVSSTIDASGITLNGGTGNVLINGALTSSGDRAISVIGQDVDQRHALNAGGDIQVDASGMLIRSASMTSGGLIELLAGSSIMINNGAETHANRVHYDAAGNIQLQDATVANELLTMMAGGNIDQQANLLTSSGNIQLNADGGITMSSNVNTTATQADIHYRANQNILLGNLAAENGTLQVQSQQGAITQQAGGHQLVGRRLEMDAHSGVGGANSAIVTEVAELSVGNRTGRAAITNTGELIVDRFHNNGAIALINTQGNVTLNTAAGGVFNRSERDAHLAGGAMNANYDVGLLSITVQNGSLFATGPVDLTKPDLVGWDALLVTRGDIGSPARPLVVYIKNLLFTQGLRRWQPVHAFGIRPQDERDSSSFQANLFDLIGSGNEQMVEVEALEEINPAIFTAVRNFYFDEIAIRLPADQQYDDDDYY